MRFCYDRIPEIIYFENSSSHGQVVSRSLDNKIRTVFEIPSPGDQRSLSCSTDGTTIAALDSHQDHLYIFNSYQLSVYKFEHSLLYSVTGEYSLLSPDGSMISVPGDPIHVSGPDILRKMRFLRAESNARVFFESGNAYIDEDRVIHLYHYIDNWKKQRSITKPSGFDVKEISRCGAHVLASLSDDDNFRLLTLDEQTTHPDWLSRIGVTGLLKAFNNFMAIDGGYGRCVFPLLPRNDVRKPLMGLATFDSQAMQRFSIEGPLLAISDDEIRLSKDGCYALFMAFKQVPEIPEFTMRQQAVMLKLSAPNCKS